MRTLLALASGLLLLGLLLVSGPSVEDHAPAAATLPLVPPDGMVVVVDAPVATLADLEQQRVATMETLAAR